MNDAHRHSHARKEGGRPELPANMRVTMWVPRGSEERVPHPWAVFLVDEGQAKKDKLKNTMPGGLDPYGWFHT
jgi:hypothetical protein